MKRIAFGIFMIAVLMKFGILPSPFGTSEPDFRGLPMDEVVLYSTLWCGYCQKARKFMDSEGVNFTEYDIETSDEGKRQYRQLRGRGVPLILVNGELVRGYSVTRLKELL